MYLTRRSNGLYLLTRNLPVICRVGDRDVWDAYPKPGDPLAVQNLCEWSAHNVFHVDGLDALQTIAVKMVARPNGDKFQLPRSDQMADDEHDGCYSVGMCVRGPHGPMMEIEWHGFNYEQLVAVEKGISDLFVGFGQQSIDQKKKNKKP